MKKCSLFVSLVMLIALCGVAFAQDSESDMDKMQRKIKQLEEQIALQQAMLEELKSELQSKQTQDTDAIKQVAKDTVDKEMAHYKGVKDLKIGGDIRVRYEPTLYDASGKEDRHRYRMRFRFKMSKEFKYGVAGHIQLATGSAKAVNGVDLGSEPVSTNQTFDRSFEEKPFWVDQAYITWTPEGQNYFTFGGGKYANPLTTTWIVWDSDVNPEGFYQTLNYKADNYGVFLTATQMMLKENSSKADAFMVGFQGGFEVKGEMASAKVAAGYSDYRDYEWNYIYSNGNTVGTLPDGTVGLTAGDFNIVDVYGEVGFKTSIPIKLQFHYAKNTGNDLTTGDYANEDQAYLFGGKIGSAKKQGSFELGAWWAHIEANSTVGAFTDSDFGHNNREGLKASFAYQIYDNLQLGFAYFRTDRIIGEDLWNKLQFDLIFKF